MATGAARRIEEVASVLRRLRPVGTDVRPELDEILASVQLEPSGGLADEAGAGAGEGRCGSGWRVAAAVAIMGLQVSTGVDVIVTYGPMIFTSVGFRSPLAGQVAVASTLLVATAPVLVAVERLGRRPLMLTGSFGCAAAYSLLALLFGTGVATDAGWRWLALLAILAFCACYSISWGPLAFLLPSEMVPTTLRGRTAAAGIVANFTSDAMVVATWPLLSGTLGAGGGFGVYALVNWSAAAFVYAVVSETRGRSLEELQSSPHGRIGTDGSRARLLKPIAASPGA